MRLALMLLLASTVAIADDEIFRCEGKDGVTVFASKPCGPDAKPVSVAPPPPGAAVSGINIEPKAAATPRTAVPATNSATPAQKERIARTEADTATADCSKLVRLLETRLHEIERRDYGLGNSYATPEDVEAAKTSDRQPVADRLDNVRTECESIWDRAYQAATSR